MKDKDCVLFVRDRRGPLCEDCDGKQMVTACPEDVRDRYRRVPFDLSAAVERVKRLLGTQSYAACDNSGGIRVRTVDDDEIRAAILGASEPEPEPWEIEAAREWLCGDPARGPTEYGARLARHFAAARRRAGR